jgi:Tol biopolymer transport system component/DNA-binding winged helix-turn-helix (wHTH) protein
MTKRLTRVLETFIPVLSSIRLARSAMSGASQAVGSRAHLPRYRFGTFELDTNSGELRKGGVKLRLQEQPYLVLRTLLESAGNIVAREDLHAALWPADTFVDFDTSLNTAIKRLREALGDSADVPVFIETIPRRGYRFLAPVQVTRNGTFSQIQSSVSERSITSNSGWWIFVGALLLAAVTGALLLAHFSSVPVPRVVDSTQITFDGLNKSDLHVRAGQIYFNERLSNQIALLKVPVTGGAPVLLSSSFPGIYLGDVSADGSKLLVGAPPKTMKGPFSMQLMDLSSGALQDFGQLLVNDGSFAPAGKIIFSKGADVFLVNGDGSGARKLLTASGPVNHLRYSPDGSRLRFTVGNPHMGQDSIWEARADGTRLHEVLTGMTDYPSRCCGEWSPDGRYFFFQTERNGTSRIWALAERHPFWRKQPAPVELTTIPLNFYMGGLSEDGRKMYVTVSQPRAELVRYDFAIHQFVPFLSGISAGDVEVSRDGEKLTYVRYPEATLWRAKVEGSEAAQITGPSLRVALPHWSPDGTRIAFSGSQPGKPWNIFLISAQGGPAEQITNGQLLDLDPTWSADGSKLAFGQARMEDDVQKVSIQLLDLASRRSTMLPGSEGLCCPRWSPDGQSLVAARPTGDVLMLYEFATGRWRVLEKDVGPTGYLKWSNDSKEVFFDTIETANPALYSIRISDSHLQTIVPTGELRRYYSQFGSWSGVAPDGSPLLVRDISSQEVYSLDLQLP